MIRPHLTKPLATVEIVHPEGIEKGSLTINESDFDPAVHTRWSERTAWKNGKRRDPVEGHAA